MNILYTCMQLLQLSITHSDFWNQKSWICHLIRIIQVARLHACMSGWKDACMLCSVYHFILKKHVLNDQLQLKDVIYSQFFLRWYILLFYNKCQFILLFPFRLYAELSIQVFLQSEYFIEMSITFKTLDNLR